MSSQKDFDKAVELLGPKVTENATKITPKDLKIPYLLRVDESVPKSFVPRMPASAASSENNTVPRVVTAPTLVGCMCGAAVMLYLLWDRRVGETGNNFYKISGFPFEHALLPNKKLVYDAEDTGEAWLIAYNKDTVEYKALPFGELFFHKVSMTVKGNSKINNQIVEFLVKVSHPEGIPFTKDIFLEKGHYYVKGDFTSYALPDAKGIPKRMSDEDSEKFVVTSITESVYKSFKDVSVKK